MRGLKVGDNVMAKWPGSMLWYPAVITEVGEDGDSYSVKFEDNFEDEFDEKHVSVSLENSICESSPGFKYVVNTKAAICYIYVKLCH